MDDPLTQVVTLLRARAVLMNEIRGRGRWGIRFPAFHVTNFALVAEGECWLHLGRDKPTPFRTGDLLLQPESTEFGFLSAPDAPTVLGDAAYKSAAGYLIELGGDHGPGTRIVGGYFEVDRVNTDLFAALLPRAVHLRAQDQATDRLAKLLDLIGEEARHDRPGRSLVVQRLAELLVVEALRRPTAVEVVAPSGLLAGLRDRQLAVVLRALHAEVGSNWKLTGLASLAGMSRSAFARRFNDTVGIAPMTYILRWRIAVAKSALINERLTLDEVAKRTGYGSAAALSHAFVRATGCTPSAFRQRNWIDDRRRTDVVDV